MNDNLKKREATNCKANIEIRLIESRQRNKFLLAIVIGCTALSGFLFFFNQGAGEQVLDQNWMFLAPLAIMFVLPLLLAWNRITKINVKQNKIEIHETIFSTPFRTQQFDLGAIISLTLASKKDPSGDVWLNLSVELGEQAIEIKSRLNPSIDLFLDQSRSLAKTIGVTLNSYLSQKH